MSSYRKLDPRPGRRDFQPERAPVYKKLDPSIIRNPYKRRQVEKELKEGFRTHDH